MAAMRFEQAPRFILAKKIFWGLGHFKDLYRKRAKLENTEDDIPYFLFLRVFG